MVKEKFSGIETLLMFIHTEYTIVLYVVCIRICTYFRGK